MLSKFTKASFSFGAKFLLNERYVTVGSKLNTRWMSKSLTQEILKPKGEEVKPMCKYPNRLLQSYPKNWKMSIRVISLFNMPKSNDWFSNSRMATLTVMTKFTMAWASLCFGAIFLLILFIKFANYINEIMNLPKLPGPPILTTIITRNKAKIHLVGAQ